MDPCNLAELSKRGPHPLIPVSDRSARDPVPHLVRIGPCQPFERLRTRFSTRSRAPPQAPSGASSGHRGSPWARDRMSMVTAKAVLRGLGSWWLATLVMRPRESPVESALQGTRGTRRHKGVAR
jgi:hypothetical protein